MLPYAPSGRAHYQRPILPILSNEIVAQLTRFLAESRLGVVRLEERQKSFEDIFLALAGKVASL